METEEQLSCNKVGEIYQNLGSQFSLRRKKTKLEKARTEKSEKPRPRW